GECSSVACTLPSGRCATNERGGTIPSHRGRSYATPGGTTRPPFRCCAGHLFANVPRDETMPGVLADGAETSLLHLVQTRCFLPCRAPALRWCRRGRALPVSYAAGLMAPS